MDGVVGWIPSCCQATKYYEVVNVEVSRAFLQVLHPPPPGLLAPPDAACPSGCETRPANAGLCHGPHRPRFSSVPERSLTEESGTSSRSSPAYMSCMYRQLQLHVLPNVDAANQEPKNPLHVCMCGRYVCCMYVCMYVQVVTE